MALFIKPITREEMDLVEGIIGKKFSDKVDTICDHIRVIYKEATDSVDNIESRNIIMNECKIVMIYAKRMDGAFKKKMNVSNYEL